MLRFLSIAVITAGFSASALAEPAFVKAVSLPTLGAGYGGVPKSVCELPAYISVRTSSTVPANGHSMTLSPRMVQAIRIGEEPSRD